MTLKDALSVIDRDLASGKITAEEADLARKWLIETVKQANEKLRKRGQMPS